MLAVDWVVLYRFFYCSNEQGEPSCAHVQREGSLVELWLNSVNLDQSAGFAARELRSLEAFVRKTQSAYDAGPGPDRRGRPASLEPVR